MGTSKFRYFPADTIHTSYLMWDIDTDKHWDLMAWDDSFKTVRVPVICIEIDTETGEPLTTTIETEYFNALIRAAVPARHCCNTRMHLHYIDKTETLVHRCPVCGREEVEPKYVRDE